MMFAAPATSEQQGPSPNRTMVCGLGKIVEVKIGSKWIRGEVMCAGGGRVKIRILESLDTISEDEFWLPSESQISEDYFRMLVESVMSEKGFL